MTKYFVTIFLIRFVFSLFLLIKAGIKGFKGEKGKCVAYCIAAIIINAAFLCGDMFIFRYNINYN